MKALLHWILILVVISSPGKVLTYDLSQTTHRRSTGGPVTVALVPFSEKRTDQINTMLDRLSKELRQKAEVRVLDGKKTDEILRYYLKYVNRTAQVQDDSVQQELTQARQDLIAGNYAAAAHLLDGVEKKIRAREAAGGTNEGLYQIHLLRAKIHHANALTPSVQAEYDKLVRIHPDLDLDPNLYSNWERSALAKAKDKIAGRRTAAIVVEARPVGSEVFLNGVHRGISPTTLKDLPPGLHVIEVKTVHYASFRQQVRLAEGQVQTVQARLARSDSSVASEETTIRPSLYKTDLEVSRLIATLGYHMGVDKIVLVADKRESGRDTLVYRAVDTQLGGVQREFQFAVIPGDASSLGPLVSSLHKEVRLDPLQDPARHVAQSVGSLDLMHKKRKPFYKRPLFWVLVGVAAGTGGALGAILGAGSAGAGGIVIGL